VVNKIRYAIIKNLREHAPELFSGKKFRPKVGHAGTLDPLATGLLIVCVGKETKNIDQYMGQEKEYIGSFYIGATTPSYDKETEVNNTFETSHINDKLIFKTTQQFIGDIEQIPPIFSAIKKNGKKLYLSAREGEEVQIDARKVSIRAFEITKIELPLIHFKVVCSKGTYIRSLAFDFGKALHSGAYLNSLCRTRIGAFKIEDAHTVDEYLARLNF
jgi:tRNA pseudouridine55 synthase